MPNVKASFTVNLGGAEATGSHLSAEIDSRPNGKNLGKTQFAPGDSVFFLIYKTDNVAPLYVTSSAGSVAYDSETTVKKIEDTLTFNTIDGLETSVSKPISAITSQAWQGVDLGAPALQADLMTFKLPDSLKTVALPDESEAAFEKRQLAAARIAVSKIQYEANAQVWRLSTPLQVNGGQTEFEVSVLITGYVPK